MPSQPSGSLRFAPISASTGPRAGLSRAISRCAFVAIFLAASAPAALALSLEAAQENCRMNVGRPTVQSCMKSLGGGKAAGASGAP